MYTFEDSTSKRVPSTKDFHALTVKGVAPSSTNYKAVGENIASMLLNSSDDIRDSGAIEEELGEGWVVRVGQCQNQAGKDWYRQSISDGKVH